MQQNPYQQPSSSSPPPPAAQPDPKSRPKMAFTMWMAIVMGCNTMAMLPPPGVWMNREVPFGVNVFLLFPFTLGLVGCYFAIQFWKLGTGGDRIHAAFALLFGSLPIWTAIEWWLSVSLRALE